MKTSTERTYWEFAMILGLLANAIARPLVMVLDRAFAILGLIFIVIPLIMVVLVWSRNRWLILLVTLLSIVFIFGALGEPLVLERLANPGALGYFMVAVLELGGLALTTIAGVGALIQRFLLRPPVTKNPQ